MDSPGTSADLGGLFLSPRLSPAREGGLTGPSAVLLIEDDPAIINSVVSSLGEAGYPALIAMDGDEARALIQRRSVGVVMFSWRFIVQLGGGEILRELRQRSASRHVPMIVFSANHAELMEATQHGVQDYIPNPLRGDDLIHVVEEYVS